MTRSSFGERFDGSDDDFADVVHVADMSARPQRRRNGGSAAESAARGSQALSKGDDADADLMGTPTGQEGCEQEDDSMCVLAAMALLALAFLAFVGYVGYQMVLSETQFATSRLPMRPQVEATHLVVRVELAQLYAGHQVQVEVDRKLVCEHCAGSGVDMNAGFHACPTCQGTGVQTFVQQIGPIKQHVRAACKTCKGRGQVAKSKCTACHGHGHRHDAKTLAVEIERGMRHGDQIVLARQGNQAPQAIPGDVVVHVKAKPHPVFTRRDDDLELTLEITLLEALVGFTREVEHLDKRVVRLERKDIVSSETIWRIPREGMPVRKGGGRTGDLLIHFAIQFPLEHEELDASVKEAIAMILPD